MASRSSTFPWKRCLDQKVSLRDLCWRLRINHSGCHLENYTKCLNAWQVTFFSKPSVYKWIHQGASRCGGLLCLKGNLVEGSYKQIHTVAGKIFCFGRLWILYPTTCYLHPWHVTMPWFKRRPSTVIVLHHLHRSNEARYFEESKGVLPHESFVHGSDQPGASCNGDIPVEQGRIHA